MTVTVDFSGEINASGTYPLIFGVGTSYRLSRNRGSMQGLGLADVRTRDQDRGDYPGEVGGIDLPRKRTIRFPIDILASSASSSYAALRDLKQAWQPQASDTTLDLKLPWFESTSNILRFYGRPRSLDADFRLADKRLIPCLASFDALDPYGYGAEETVTDSSSPASVTNSGDVASDRFTITITGNGGTPVLTSTTDDNSVISWGTTLANLATAVLDFRTHTVTVGGNDAYDQLAAGPEWFRLRPGANTLTFTGCTSIEVDHRPAFL